MATSTGVPRAFAHRAATRAARSTAGGLALLGLLGAASASGLPATRDTLVHAQAPWTAHVYAPALLKGRFTVLPPTAVPTIVPTATGSRVPSTPGDSPTPGDRATPTPTPSSPPGTPPLATPTGSPPPTPTHTSSPPAPTVIPTRPAPLTARVDGSVYAAPDASHRFAVPGVVLQLVSPADGSVAATTRSDRIGLFHFRPLAPGTYGLCREAPGLAGVCGIPFDLARDVTLEPIAIEASPSVVYGIVQSPSGERCSVVDGQRRVRVETTVELQEVGGGRLGDPVTANAFGEYVLGGVPADGRFRVAARCGGTSVSAPVANIGDRARRVDLVLPNERPHVDAVEVRLGDVGIRHAAPGAVVDVTALASDADGEGRAPRLSWHVGKGDGALVSSDAATARWRLPDRPGTFTIDVVADDGRGGYDRATASLIVGVDAARFRGRVLDAASHEPVADAVVVARAGDVTVRGATDRNGRFELAGDWSPDANVVLTIGRAGYAPLVLDVDGEVKDAALRLVPLPSSAVDPAAAVALVDARPALRSAGRSGATVSLPAASLVAADDGSPAAGPLTGEIVTLDPSYEALPGRPQGSDREGVMRHLEPYGAVRFAFRDAANGGRAFAPRAGTRIDLTIPISATRAVSAPARLPIWALDAAKGTWVDSHGVATLERTAFGPAYVGNVPAPDPAGNPALVNGIGTGYVIALPDGFDITCVRVAPDPLLIPGGTTLIAEVRYFNTVVATYSLPITGNAPLYPFLQVPRAGVLRLKLLDTNGQLIANAVKNVSLNRPSIAGEGAANIPFPYSACGTPIPFTIPYPSDIALDGYGKPLLLQGFGFPDYVGQGLTFDDVGEGYYQAIDDADHAYPNDKRATLGKWWQTNGFGVKGDGIGDIRAYYLNHNDLGFGRKMRCLDNGGDVACYVSNFGDAVPKNLDAYADLAAAGSPADGVATVTMEYRALPDDPNRRVTTFYVYAGVGAAAPRVPVADLDGFGPKPVPNLCTTCHGGRYDPLDPLAPTFADVDMGSSFREFDLTTFHYTAGRDHSQLTNPEYQSFRDLNDLVRDRTAPAPAIAELVDGWYGTVALPKPGPAPDLVPVPSGWSGAPEDALYRDVVAPSCRTCHVARPSLDFASYPDLSDGTLGFASRRGSIAYRVCGDPQSGAYKVMPNALVTYRNFWQSASPHRPNALAAFADARPATTWGAIGVCK